MVDWWLQQATISVMAMNYIESQFATYLINMHMVGQIPTHHNFDI